MAAIKELTHIVQHEVEDYAKPIACLLFLINQKASCYSGVVVVARIVDDKVIIDEDITDRPLWEELVRAGIPANGLSSHTPVRKHLKNRMSNQHRMPITSS